MGVGVGWSGTWAGVQVLPVMGPTEQALGKSAEGVIMLQCVPGYITLSKLNFGVQVCCFTIHPVSMFPEKCYETILHLSAAVLMSTQQLVMHGIAATRGPETLAWSSQTELQNCGPSNRAQRAEISEEALALLLSRFPSLCPSHEPVRFS